MRNAKKLVALCCVGAMAFSLAACKPDNPADTTTSTTETQETESAAETETSTEAPVSNPTDAASPSETTEAPQGPKTTAEILAVYNDAYNKTKAKGTFLGKDVMTVSDVMLGGKVNSLLNGTVSKLGSSMYKPSTDNALSPKADGFSTSKVTESDLASAEIKDNGSTWYVKLVPIDADNPTAGSPGPGRIFDVMPDIVPYLDQVPGGIKWTTGSAQDNLVLKYSGGYVEATIDKASGTFTSAKYDAVCTLNIDNAKALGLSINGASIRIETITTFPA